MPVAFATAGFELDSGCLAGRVLLDVVSYV
jgi:hypothetical protein